MTAARTTTATTTASAVLAPVTDLAWSADRARALDGQVVDLWGEWLERLPSLPVGGRATATYTGHPGFMAYITGAGTVPGAAADLLATALNQNAREFSGPEL